ncbi:MAG: hypothetical protein MJ238_01225 [Bacilli bacterium]|nr:hypothetical protein [Bacilli bacterium]
MKKTKITLAVALLSVAMLAACGGKGDKSSKPASENTESSVPAPGSSESSAPAVESSSEAHVHSFGGWTTTKEATHTAEGEEQRVCACGEKETRTVAKTTDHEFGAWTVKTAATHTKEGVEERACACGEKETRPIAKTTAHEFGGWTTASQETCTTAEVLQRTCACGETETKDGKPATGHDLWSDWRYDANNHWHGCKYDATEQLDKGEHVYDRTVLTEEYLKSTATPTSGNSYSMSCVCGKAGTSTYNDWNYVKVKSYTWIKEPTVDESGIIKCSYDNFKDYTFQIPELGNTLFWKAEEVKIPGGTTMNYTYSNTKVAVMSSNNWAKSNYDSKITETSQASLAYFLAYAGTPQGAFGTIGLSYTTTTMDPVEAVFENGYCAETGEETFRFVIEDVLTITDRGTLVSGKVLGASVSVGDKITYYEYGTNNVVEYTVSRIEAFQKALDTALPGSNVGIYFEENPERASIVRGSLLADPAGNWTKTSSVTGKVYLNNQRHTPISNGFRPQVAWSHVGDTSQLTFPTGLDLIMPGGNADNITINLLTPQYIFGGLGEYAITEGGKKIGYVVLGDYEGKTGEYFETITVQAKSKGTDTTTAKYTVTEGHFFAEDGKTYEDPLMKTALAVKKYELFVGVTGCGTIAGRGTYLTCASNNIYEKDSSGWKASGSVEMNDSYTGKMMATVEFVDADGVLTSSQHAITGTEKKSDGTYSFLMRGLERDAAENAVRMYVEA